MVSRALAAVDPARLREHLEHTGWRQVEEYQWRLERDGLRYQVVCPPCRDFADYLACVCDTVQTLAIVEGRASADILATITRAPAGHIVVTQQPTFAPVLKWVQPTKERSCQTRSKSVSQRS
jgi:hypothetical protein